MNAGKVCACPRTVDVDEWCEQCNQAGIYGTKGTPDPANIPGARTGATSWTDNDGKFWLFGGSENAAPTLASE